MLILKKIIKVMYIIGKTILIGIIAIISIILLIIISTRIVNNITASNVKNDIKKLPLPNDTELIDSISLAGKLTGNGNGMQYFGAILIKSELTLEELKEHYLQHNKDNRYYSVEVQTEEYIWDFNRGPYKFNISNNSIPLINHYIVSAWGDSSYIFNLFDIRAN